MTRTTTGQHTSQLFSGSSNKTSVHSYWPSSPAADVATADDFVRALRNAVTGVNIVTTDGLAGRFGLTVSAFSSVSAEPPLVLVCINARSPACAAIRSNDQFCVNVLSTTQRELADRFAGRPEVGRPYDFTTAHWHRALTGSPVLADAAASIDCVLATAIDAGTHRIFIGRVLAAIDGAQEPLLYTNRTYGRPQHCH